MYRRGANYGTEVNDYTVQNISYDLNGNIQSLKRNGGADLIIDDLTYAYNANQLTKVDDAANAQGFTDVASSTDYMYDNNGNLVSDVNKGITNITYNYLNLPEMINFTNGTITFLYDANGNKLSKTVSTGVQKDYLGGIEYNNGTVEAVYHEEGRVTLNNNIWQYEYSLKDHLGNTRVIFTDTNNDGTPEIIQESDYYPFGMQHASSTTATNHYLYNGKELNEDLGLDWYDYGARWLDVETGRWSSIDPLAESYASMSPFNYVANNPISNIDPDGRKIEYYGTEEEITKVLNALKFQFNTVSSMEYEFITDKNGLNIGVSIHKYVPVKGEENDISHFLSTVVNSPQVTTIKKVINTPRRVDDLEVYGGMRFLPRDMVVEVTDQWFTGKWANSGMKPPSYKYIVKSKSWWYDDAEIPRTIPFEEGLAHELIHVARKLLGQTANGYMKEENEVKEIMNTWREKNNIRKRGVNRKANFFERKLFGVEQMEKRYEYDDYK